MRQETSLSIFLLSAILACGSDTVKPTADDNEIKYSSIDRTSYWNFSPNGARLDAVINISAASNSPSARYFETDDHVKCVSVGLSHNSVQYAIKRPIKAGEKYNCLHTRFQVLECFNDCKAAIIGIEQPLRVDEIKFYKSQIYVDNCTGIQIFDVNNDLREGITRQSVVLRGYVGILADDKFPYC